MKLLQALLLCWLAVSSSVHANIPDKAGDVNQQVQQPAADIKTLLNQLPKSSYDDKAVTLKNIAALNDEKSLLLLTSLLDGDLFYVKKTKLVVYREKQENKRYLATDAITGEDVGEFKKRKLKKIGINNSLRGTLNGLIAELQISSPDISLREKAALELLKKIDATLLVVVNKALITEEDDHIRSILNTAKSIHGLKADTSEARLVAIAELDGSLYPETRIALNQFI